MREKEWFKNTVRVRERGKGEKKEIDEEHNQMKNKYILVD